MASSETELFKDKIEVSLDGRQIFYLFFGGAVIATLVFVLGVMVGRRVESRSIAETGSPATDPLAALDRLEGGGELAFPAALRGDDVLLGSMDATLAGRSEAAKVNMATGGPSAVEPVVNEPTAAEAEAESKLSAKVSKPAPGAPPVASEKPTKPEKPLAKAALVESASDLDESDEGAEPAAKAKRRRFTLQVGSFQDKEEADTFFRGLAGSTYDPYMVEADVPGKGKYFRVRVGGYGSFDEAVAAKAEFEASQHVIAYVTRLK